MAGGKAVRAADDDPAIPYDEYLDRLVAEEITAMPGTDWKVWGMTPRLPARGLAHVWLEDVLPPQPHRSRLARLHDRAGEWRWRWGSRIRFALAALRGEWPD